MTQLELPARPPAPEPRDVPGGDLHDAIKREVLGVLVVYAQGRANAITGERMAELVGQRLVERGHPHGLSVRTLTRRCQEAAADLRIHAGEPIGSSSTPPRGYWWALTADELEETLAQAEQRAREAFRNRRGLRRVMARMRGQQEIRGVA